jgi:hypothetical protein
VLDRLQSEQHGWSEQSLGEVAARVTVRSSGVEALVELDEGGLARSLRGKDCDEVTSAAALILAVALGASAPAPPPQEPPQPSPASPSISIAASPTPPAPSPVSAAPELERKAALRRARARRPAAAVVAPRAAMAVEDHAAVVAPARSRSDLAVELGASGELEGWTAPGPAWLASIALDLVSRSHGWSARGAAVYGARETSVSGRRAAFSYWGAHADLCPIVRGATAWRWSACTELHAGLSTAQGDESSALAGGRTQRALLAAGAVSTRLEAPPLWGARIGVETGVAVPLVRQTFQFDAPTEVIFESPPVGLFGRVGLQVALGGSDD